MVILIHNYTLWQTLSIPLITFISELAVTDVSVEQIPLLFHTGKRFPRLLIILRFIVARWGF